MSTVPSLSQDFVATENGATPKSRLQQIEELEIKLAALRVDVAGSKLAPRTTPKDVAVPKVAATPPVVSTPKAVPTQREYPNPKAALVAQPVQQHDLGDVPMEMSKSPPKKADAVINIGDEHTMEPANLNMVALHRIANLPDGDCKSALMALCELQMTQVEYHVCH